MIVNPEQHKQVSRKTAQLELDEQPPAEFGLEGLFNLSPDLLGITGRDGYFKRVNPAFEKIMGYTTEELLATPFISLVHPDDQTATLAELERQELGTPAVHFENRYRCKDQSYRWLAWTIAPSQRRERLYVIACEQQWVKWELRPWTDGVGEISGLIVSTEVILSQVLADLKVAIAESQAVVTHDPLPTVIGDEIQLIQLFQNLIGNGIKFCQDKPPRVHISTEQKQKEWVFEVRDNGIGMESEFFERIFTIFQRLHSRTEYPGTGIGLAVCKKIVERHGGQIWVESTLGEGTTFYFSIPQERQGSHEV